jgi:D-amino-acid dehydrogenase
MKIIVVGAGVIGVTTAWYLTANGHEVTVIERHDEVAQETSFGNAGGICPGFAGPWAAPGIPLKALGWMFQSQAPLKFRPQADLRQWIWLAQFLRNCTAGRFAANKTRMQRMAHYSKACLIALRDETGISYDQGTNGVLQIFASPSDIEAGARSAAVLKDLGIQHKLVSADEVRQIEPGLVTSSVALTGGLHLPTDEVGDCHLFCKALAPLATERGCQFLMGRSVSAIVPSDGRVSGVLTLQDGLIESDAVVVATGPQAPALLKPLGIGLPVYPVKGYSMTCEITEPDIAPQSSVMDEHSKVMITRLGNRLRAAGVAELAGFDRRIRPATLDHLRARVEALFPGAANYAGASFWHGFRPMTPDGVARIGRTGYGNLYLNTGHGSNGWTQACGAARVLADIIDDSTPEIEF